MEEKEARSLLIRLVLRMVKGFIGRKLAIVLEMDWGVHIAEVEVSV